MALYLGRESEYWITLQERADSLDVVKHIKEISDLISENGKLRGKVSFYEDRIEQMVELKRRTK